MWFSVAVNMSFVSLQVAGIAETSVTQWTLVWFVSCVDSHVCVQICRHSKCLVTYVTFEWFVSRVDSHVFV